MARMHKPGLVVVGSGPAGLSAAETFRRHHPRIPVYILTADAALPYARPPLSKEFLRGKQSQVGLHPQDWFDDHNVEVITSATVNRIDVDHRTVLTSGGQRFGYWHLVLACGAAPSPLPVPGARSVLYLRSLADAVALRATAEHADSAVVIGAGFIGCEAAASLAMRGVAVTLVAPDRLPQEARLGVEAGERIVDLLSDAGVRFVGSVSVEAVEENAVLLDNGVTIDCDLVLAATGVTPQSALAAGAGITTHDGRIIVDEHMHTSAVNVLAAGDVALAWNRTAGRRIAVEHWQDAVDQGAIAGSSAAGASAVWEGVPGFWSTIGDATLKYHAWGDGYDHSRLVQHDNGFTVWYEAGGAAVGALTLNADDDYDRAENIIRCRDPVPVSPPLGTGG